MNVNIGLSPEQRQATAKVLGRVLADEYVLYTKTRGFHWNVTGARFGELHKLFEAQYDELAAAIDEIAERSRALGAYATGSLQGMLDNARLSEAAGGRLADSQMLGELLRDHEALARSLREDIGTVARLDDEGTTDFLTGLLQQHEKTAWMLRSYVES